MTQTRCRSVVSGCSDRTRFFPFLSEGRRKTLSSAFNGPIFVSQVYTYWNARRLSALSIFLLKGGTQADPGFHHIPVCSGLWSDSKPKGTPCREPADRFRCSEETEPLQISVKTAGPLPCSLAGFTLQSQRDNHFMETACWTSSWDLNTFGLGRICWATFLFISCTSSHQLKPTLTLLKICRLHFK